MLPINYLTSKINEIQAFIINLLDSSIFLKTDIVQSNQEVIKSIDNIIVECKKQEETSKDSLIKMPRWLALSLISLNVITIIGLTSWLLFYNKLKSIWPFKKLFKNEFNTSHIENNLKNIEKEFEDFISNFKNFQETLNKKIKENDKLKQGGLIEDSVSDKLENLSEEVRQILGEDILYTKTPLNTKVYDYLDTTRYALESNYKIFTNLKIDLIHQSILQSYNFYNHTYSDRINTIKIYLANKQANNEEIDPSAKDALQLTYNFYKETRETLNKMLKNIQQIKNEFNSHIAINSFVYGTEYRFNQIDIKDYYKSCITLKNNNTIFTKLKNEWEDHQKIFLREWNSVVQNLPLEDQKNIMINREENLQEKDLIIQYPNKEYHKEWNIPEEEREYIEELSIIENESENLLNISSLV